MTTPETIDPQLSPLEQVKELASATLADQELSRLAIWARLDEPQRRKEAESSRTAAATATQELVAQLWAAQPDLKPAFSDSPEGAPAWVEPSSDFTAYPAGVHVSHREEVWRNDLGTLNLATPGEGQGWNDVTPIIADGTRDAPYQWAGGLELHGGEYVTHEGTRYIVTETHTAEESPDQLVGTTYERISG